MKHALSILGLIALTAPAAMVQAAGGGDLQASIGGFKMQNLGSGSVPVKGPVIAVEYDRDLRRYTQVKGQLHFPVAVAMGCDSGWHFIDFKIDAAGVRSDGPMGSLAKTGSGWNGTSWATRNYKAAPAVGNPIEVCNSLLDLFVQQDKHGVAQKGWAKKYYNAYPVEVELSCRKPGKKKKVGFDEPDTFGGDSASLMFDAWVHCLPAAVFKTTSGPKPPVKKVGLQSAEVWINPMSNADYKGPCPKKLTFGGKANFLKGGDSPYELHYRYRTKDGDASPILKTTYTKSGEQILKSWQKDFGAAGPAAGTYKVAGGSSGPQVISSWVKLEILASKPPYQVLETRQGNHRLTCEQPKDPGTQYQSGGSGPGGGKKPPIATKFVAASAKPDLRIVSAEKHGNTGKALIVVVVNDGPGASKATRLKLFYGRSGRTVTSLASVPALASKEQKRVVIESASPLAHASSLGLRVDDPNVNNETNEGNNSFKVE